jgi:hypothetical protein
MAHHHALLRTTRSGAKVRGSGWDITDIGLMRDIALRTIAGLGHAERS